MCNFLLRCVLFPLALCTLSAPDPVAAASSPPAAADPATSPTPPAPLALPEALRLRGQAEAVMATGRFTEGLALAQEALARAELLLPPGHKELPDFLIAVGYAHANRAEHASARTYYLRARTAAVQAGGPESPGVAFCETLLGLLAKEEGDLVTAAGHNDRAIATDQVSKYASNTSALACCASSGARGAGILSMIACMSAASRRALASSAARPPPTAGGLASIR